MNPNESNQSNAMSAEEIHNFCHPFRSHRLAQRVSGRSGAEDRPLESRLSREFIFEQAADRFVYLVEETEEELPTPFHFSVPDQEKKRRAAFSRLDSRAMRSSSGRSSAKPRTLTW